MSWGSRLPRRLGILVWRVLYRCVYPVGEGISPQPGLTGLSTSLVWRRLGTPHIFLSNIILGPTDSITIVCEDSVPSIHHRREESRVHD